MNKQKMLTRMTASNQSNPIIVPAGKGQIIYVTKINLKQLINCFQEKIFSRNNNLKQVLPHKETIFTDPTKHIVPKLAKHLEIKTVTNCYCNIALKLQIWKTTSMEMNYHSLEKILLIKITTFRKIVFQTNLLILIQGGKQRPKNEYDYQK